MIEKERLRRIYIEKRDGLSREEILYKSRSIEERLFENVGYKEASSILFYVSFRSEVNTLPLLKRSIEEGKRVLVPVTDKKRKILHIAHLESISALKESTYGIKEPSLTSSRSISYQEVELVIVPGVIFDERGFRVGYGGGYYDRLLVQLGEDVLRMGLAFEIQLLERLSPEVHDQPVHTIITEERTLYIGEEGV